MKSSYIISINVSLAIAVVAVWAVILARRNVSAALSVAEPPAGAAVRQMPPDTAVTPTAAPAAPLDAAELPLQEDDATALRGEIRQIRKEASSELAQMRSEAEERRELNRQWAAEHPRESSSPPPTLGELAARRDEMPEYYEKVEKILVSSAQKRIQARQIILQALEETELTDEQLSAIQEYFAKLDEIDASITVREYTQEDMMSLFRNIPHKHELDQLILETLDPDTIFSSEMIYHVSASVPGRFFFLHDDMRAMNGEEE
ncbi:MAG: hypothetical protein J5654_05935 [Victivallales bacterium]|nr:hypothetical protein [Victivallales bacterium]